MLFSMITFVVSRSMFKNAMSRSLCCPIAVTMYVLILRRAENDRSALLNVAGIAQVFWPGQENNREGFSLCHLSEAIEGISVLKKVHCYSSSFRPVLLNLPKSSFQTTVDHR